MKVNLVIAAREVEADEDTNDLNIFGVFTEALTRGLPAYHPLINLILFCEAEVSEFGQEKLVEIELRYADGELQQSWYDSYVVPEARRLGERSFSAPIFPLADVPFVKAGNYAFHILVDKRHENSLPFYVHSPPETSELEEGGR